MSDWKKPRKTTAERIDELIESVKERAQKDRDGRTDLFEEIR